VDLARDGEVGAQVVLLEARQPASLVVLRQFVERAVKDLDLRGSVVVRTAVTSHAPQLAAAGLAVTVVPVSAIAAGFSGAVRPLEPQLAGAKGEQP
jgi:hypothetical protein